MFPTYYTKQNQFSGISFNLKSSNYLFNYNHNSDPEEKVQKLELIYCYLTIGMRYSLKRKHTLDKTRLQLNKVVV